MLTIAGGLIAINAEFADLRVSPLVAARLVHFPNSSGIRENNRAQWATNYGHSPSFTSLQRVTRMVR